MIETAHDLLAKLAGHAAWRCLQSIVAMTYLSLGVAERFAPHWHPWPRRFGALSRGGGSRAMCRAALDLGTSQACAMKIPARTSGTGKSSRAWCKTHTRG